jgi:hypothetical protein
MNSPPLTVLILDVRSTAGQPTQCDDTYASHRAFEYDGVLANCERHYVQQCVASSITMSSWHKRSISSRDGTERTPLLAGINTGPVMIDFDDSIVEVHGHCTQRSRVRLLPAFEA